MSHNIANSQANRKLLGVMERCYETEYNWSAKYVYFILTSFDLCDLETQNPGWHPSTHFLPSYGLLIQHGCLLLTHNAAKVTSFHVGRLTIMCDVPFNIWTHGYKH